MLFLLPLLAMEQILAELQEKDERYLELLTRERLIHEMQSFQDLLDPEKYLKHALEDMHREFGFVAMSNTVKPLLHNTENDPGLITADFNRRACEFLKARYGINPFFIVSADCDLQNIYPYFLEPFFYNDEEQKEFEAGAIYNTFFSECEPVNELSYTESLVDKLAAHRLKYGNTKNVQAIFAELFRQHISVFTNPPQYKDISQKFFSNRFGNQRSYQMFHRISRQRGDSGAESILGGYHICVNGSDISPRHMLEHAQNSISAGAGRFFSDKTVSTQTFTEDNHKLYYHAGFPSVFHNAVEDSGIKDQATCNALRRYIRNHSLATTAELGEMKSIFGSARFINAMLIKFALLFGFALAVRLFLGGSLWRASLGLKLRITVALIVLIPLAGFFIVSELIKSSSKKLEIIKYQQKMQKQIGLFEKIVTDNNARLQIMLSENKKLTTLSFFKFCREIIQKAATNSYLSYFSDTGVTNVTFSVDRNGLHVESPAYHHAPDQSKTRATLFRFLKELDVINHSSPESHKLLNQQLFLSSFTEAFSSQYMTGANLARESFISPNFLTFAPLKRACMHLLASESTPLMPEAILIQEVKDLDTLGKMFKQLKKDAFTLFSEYDGNCQIDYGLFLRSPTNLRSFQIPEVISGSNPLRELALQANDQRTSVSSVTRENDRFVLRTWVFSDASPAIIAARGVLKAEHPGELLFSILPLFLLLYAMSATILLSDLLAGIFLAPVRALLEFVSQIKANNLNVEARIYSRDEFGELAASFNAMGNGLVQKEKMRRFVSDKLFTTLEENRESNDSRKVTLSVLSSDIRGFTIISEENEPEVIVSLLNDYFSAMQSEIHRAGGSIEKIVGDAITAAFYEEPENSTHHSIRACMAAVAMKKRLAAFNQERQKKNLLTIETGIGISSGEAILGFAGTSVNRREFVLLGEVIHTAEQLESMTRYGRLSRIFIDQTTLNALKNSDFKSVEVNSNELKAWELENV